MAQNFSVAISKLAEKYADRYDRIVRKVELDITKSVVLRTPVDTGRARGSWSSSIGAPTARATDRLDPRGEASIAEAARVSAQAPQGGHIFYLSSALPYIVRLEFGWSRQAPQGMVRLAIAEFQQVVRDAAEAERER